MRRGAMDKQTWALIAACGAFLVSVATLLVVVTRPQPTPAAPIRVATQIVPTVPSPSPVGRTNLTPPPPLADDPPAAALTPAATTRRHVARPGDPVLAPSILPASPRPQPARVPVAPVAAPPPQAASPMRAQPSPAPRQDGPVRGYLAWLRWVEHERSGLSAQGKAESARIVESLMAQMISNPEPDPRATRAQREALARASVATAQRAEQFVRNIRRTKPPVPDTCQALDAAYDAAMTTELDANAATLDAMRGSDLSRMKQISSQATASIRDELREANAELRRVFDLLGQQPSFSIATD